MGQTGAGAEGFLWALPVCPHPPGCFLLSFVSGVHASEQGCLASLLPV